MDEKQAKPTARRLEEIFGRSGVDEDRDQPDEVDRDGGRDRWYQENRPPHHDQD